MNERKFSWTASIAYIVAAIALIFTLSVCTSGTSYEGTGAGDLGPITVEITVNEGKIIDGKIVSISETEFALSAVGTILEQAIKAGNADNLDVITGATFASQGTIAAIQAAFAASKETLASDEIVAEDNKD